MKKLTESLLALARAEGGEDPQRENTNLASVARLSVERIRPLAEKHGLHLSCDMGSTPARANPERLAQVVTNLLANAIHYNKPNGRIDVATQIEEGFATLVVSDSGQGIGPEDLPHVFERFYRADKSRSRSAGHAGLGLAICKSIVENEGGTISITSELGVGTKVTVRLISASLLPAA